MRQKTCVACGKELKGRSDKRFCDLHCKSTYHYRKSQEEEPRFFNKVDNQLKTNRKILKQYNKAGKATVRSSLIIGEVFSQDDAEKCRLLDAVHVCRMVKQHLLTTIFDGKRAVKAADEIASGEKRWL